VGGVSLNACLKVVSTSLDPDDLAIVGECRNRLAGNAEVFRQFASADDIQFNPLRTICAE
jgi:hypothetical protein